MSFMEALASCVRVTGAGVTYLNSISVSANADDASAVTCGGSEMADQEAFVVANAFGIDDSGNLAIKIGTIVE